MVKEFTPEELEDKRLRFTKDFGGDNRQRDDLTDGELVVLMAPHLPPGLRMLFQRKGKKRRISIYFE